MQESLPEGLAFDDVLLVPQHSDVMPSDVRIDTRFSRNVQLNIPLSSSAMDTVTEWQLAVTLAREGGIGVVHRNLSIGDQVAEVEKVKRSANGVIRDPLTLPPTARLSQARELMASQNISGLCRSLNTLRGARWTWGRAASSRRTAVGGASPAASWRCGCAAIRSRSPPGWASSPSSASRS